MEHQLLQQKIIQCYQGASFGDAYALPVEFYSRDYIREEYPVITEPLGYMAFNQPPLTFSDDSSLLFCATESLIGGFDVEDMAHRFCLWHDPATAYWSARGEIFDVGITTAKSLKRYAACHMRAELCGDDHPMSAGNAGVTRSLALAFYTLRMTPDEIFRHTMLVSSITHRHPVAILTAFYYVVYIQHVLIMDRLDAYHAANELVKAHLPSTSFSQKDISALYRVLEGIIPGLEEDKVYSSPYCVHTLECSLWSVLRASSFKNALDTVVALGEDTDSNGFLTSSIASLVWGIEDIAHWLPEMARHRDILDLAERFAASLSDKNKEQQVRCPI
ncbi:ADP-ribosylglycohydrolase family protein [Pontibacter litorisediminis]|uniref:ADP-ribosylglycohydrolase family protein n=1 Tax=Pontibacter litorisediminis TaxID=1846260 RepID=UPI0023EDB5FB|nr:ADP-ribosylglycohydrolase family protein [Pontibacter litorisediminis]